MSVGGQVGGATISDDEEEDDVDCLYVNDEDEDVDQIHIDDDDDDSMGQCVVSLA